MPDYRLRHHSMPHIIRRPALIAIIFTLRCCHYAITLLMLLMIHCACADAIIFEPFDIDYADIDAAISQLPPLRH